MAVTKYTYVISTGTLNGVVSSGALISEIHSSSIVTSVDHVETAADALDIFMKEALAAGDQTTLTQVVNAHAGIALAPAPATVVIKEESENATGGHYQSQSFDIVIDHAVGTWKELDISFPYPISLFSSEWIHQATMEGDIIEVLVAPDTIIGAISANVAATDTVIPVQQSVIDITYIGARILIDDGTNADECGRVIAVDDVANTITVETATTNAFLSATPTYIKQTIEFVPKMTLRGTLGYALGKDIIGGSYVPANTVLRTRYKNVEGSTTGKTFSVVMEYKY